MLYLVGNPIVLVHDYREIMKQNFPNLIYIDNVLAVAESESPKKRRKRLEELKNKKIEIKNDISLNQIDKYQNTIIYNEMDCKSMWIIIKAIKNNLNK